METITILDQDIHVEIVFYFHGCAAKIHALPEDCHEGEPATIEWELAEDTSEFIQEAITNSDKWTEYITEQLLEIMANYTPEPNEDFRYEEAC